MNDNSTTNDTRIDNKTIPEELHDVIVKALSFYSSLNDIRIEFLFRENIQKSVMQAQPKFISMLKVRRPRSYIIKIRRYFHINNKKIPIHELPEDVLIGWIGHELGHIMDYRTKNTWSMILFGIGYLTSKGFIISAERAADSYAVNHGLGDYIITTKNFILHEAGMPISYIAKINKLYLPPEEIIEMMENDQKELLKDQ